MADWIAFVTEEPSGRSRVATAVPCLNCTASRVTARRSRDSVTDSRPLLTDFRHLPAAREWLRRALEWSVNDARGFANSPLHRRRISTHGTGGNPFPRGSR